MTEVMDISRNDDGEITQFLIFNGGQPETKRGTPENLLLFDPEDKMPFDNGLYDFLAGDSALRLSEDPPIIVQQAGDEYSYILQYDDSLVETTPSQAEELLEAMYDAIADGSFSRLEAFVERVLKSQVRRHVINPLVHTFSERRRIEIAPNGWLVDGFILVDWDAKMYASNDDPDEGDYVRSGGKAVKKDRTYEFVQLEKNFTPESNETVTIDGTEYQLTEREMLFLAKVKWLLNRREYHPDNPFWSYVDKWTNIEDDADEPNLDKFSL